MVRFFKNLLVLAVAAFDKVSTQDQCFIPVKVCQQNDGGSCAYYCARAALEWFKIKYTCRKLWYELEIHKGDGVSFIDVAKALRKRGLPARYHSSTPRRSTIMRCIRRGQVLLGSRVLASGIEHSVVISGFTKNAVLINDPLSPKLQAVSIKELEGEFIVTGRAKKMGALQSGCARKDKGGARSSRRRAA